MKDFKIPAKPVPPSPKILDVSAIVAADKAKPDLPWNWGKKPAPDKNKASSKALD